MKEAELWRLRRRDWASSRVIIMGCSLDDDDDDDAAAAEEEEEEEDVDDGLPR